jgi:hypothetical protein
MTTTDQTDHEETINGQKGPKKKKNCAQESRGEDSSEKAKYRLGRSARDGAEYHLGRGAKEIARAGIGD